LDVIFNKDILGLAGTGVTTSDTYRYATINGVLLALPTAGRSNYNALANNTSDHPGTAIGNSSDPSLGSNALNSSYDDILAIWDAYNGTGTESHRPGMEPPGWMEGFYWLASAHPSIAERHGYFSQFGGDVGFWPFGHPDIPDNYDRSDFGFVALEVLSTAGALPVVDTTAPTATLNTGVSANTANATVQSSEVGTAYLVKTGGSGAVTVSNLASITNAGDAKFNSVAIIAASTGTPLSLAGLEDGTYSLFTVDAAGNLSAAAANTFTVDSAPPTLGVSTAVISTSFEESSLISALKLDIPNPSVATITLDTTNDELDFNASGNTNMWGSRQDVPIAYVMSPQVGLNQSWSVETKLRINDVGASRQVAGLTFYSDADGVKPTFTFGLEGWNAGGNAPSYSGLFIALEALGSGRIREADNYNANSVYLKVEVTEKGSSDDYRFFYKENSSDPWTQHGGSAYVLTSSADNARTGLWYKTEAAKPGAAFDELKLVGETVPAWAVATTTIAGSAGNSAGETITLTLTFNGNVNGLISGSNDTIFTVGGSGVNASWAGTNGTNTRTLTYTVASNQNGQAAIDEAALKATLSASILDAAGNAFAYSANDGNIPNIDSTALPVVDTSAPVTPNLTLATGVASGATLAEATTALLTLTAESGAGTVVTFSRTGGGTVSKTITGNGSTPVTVSLTSAELTTLGNGSINVSAVATDAAGNASSAASSSFQLDTAAPTLGLQAPTVIDLGNGNGKLIAPVQVQDKFFYFWDFNGNSSPDTSDFRNHHDLDLVFKYASDLVTLNPANDSSDIYRYATLNGVALALPTLQELQAVHQLYDLPGSWLEDPWGSYYWTATAGGSSDHHACYSLLSNDIHSNDPDWYAMGVALQALVATGPAVSMTTLAGTAGNSAGEAITLTVTFDGNVNGLTAGSNSAIFTVSGTGVPAAWSGSGSSRTLTYTIAAGQNGQAAINETALKDALIAGVTDAAGNAFAYSANGGNIPNIDSTPLPVVDTQAPTTSIASAALSVDSGTSGNDFITNTASQTISGNLSANLAAGETVLVSLNNGTDWLAASGSVGSNAWSLASQTLIGSNTLKVKVTDAAGNDGAVFTQAYTITPNQAPVNQLPIAQLPTGLSWTTVGAYSVYSFTQVGTSTFNLASALNVEALVVAGGAAGAWSSNLATGGGGGGGVAYVPALPLSSGAYTVTIGLGGIASPGSTNYSGTTYNGGYSSIVGSNVSVTVYGGGGGGGFGGDNGIPGGSGGGGHWSSGQGGAATPGIATGIANVSFYGHAGGRSDGLTTAGGGGGGATTAGANATTGAGGAGGQGITSSITGTAVVYGSGGGGAGSNSSGLGGTNGGNAATVGSPATSGVANTGGGGGAGGDGSSGRQNNGSGGSGIVVLRALTGIQVAADTPQAITGLQISDPDLTGVFTVSFTQTQGVLTVDQNVPSGLTAAGITGNETASVALTGTLAQINATLAAAKGLVLRANAGYTGPAQLTMSTSDSQGATDTDVIAIQVTADVTAPTLSSTAPTTALGTALAGSAGNSAGETITLTLTFDGNVNGLTSGNNNTIFTVAGTGVNATWAGTNGTNTRTLTYTVASSQNGQAAINEAALKTALIAGIADAAGNAFAYTANSGNIPNIDSTALPVVDTTGPTLTNPVLARYIRIYHNASAAREDILSLTGLRAMVGEVDVAANLLATASTNITAGTDSGTLNTVAFAPAALVDSTVGNAFTGQSGAASGLAYVTTTQSATAVTSNKVFIDVDLGAVYRIDNLLLWGRNTPDTAGQSDNLRVFMGTTAPGSQTYTQLSASTAFVDVGTVAATPGGAGTTIAINSLEASPTLTNGGAQPGNSLLVTTSTLAGSAGNSVGETITLTLNFDGTVNGLSSSTNSTIFTVGGTGVPATWSGTGTTRTLTYTIASGQNGQAAIDEVALKEALIAGITDAAGNAFAYSGNIPNIDASALPVVEAPVERIQYATAVTASSGFNDSGPGYGALIAGGNDPNAAPRLIRHSKEQVLGSPDSSDTGDGRAWAPLTADNSADEWIEVGFSGPAYAESVFVRQMPVGASNGFVSKIELIDINNGYHTVFEGADPHRFTSTQAINSRFDFPRTDYLVKGAKVHIETSGTHWEIVDSIALVGFDSPSFDAAKDFMAGPSDSMSSKTQSTGSQWQYFSADYVASNISNLQLLSDWDTSLSGVIKRPQWDGNRAYNLYPLVQKQENGALIIHPDSTDAGGGGRAVVVAWKNTTSSNVTVDLTGSLNLVGDILDTYAPNNLYSQTPSNDGIAYSVTTSSTAYASGTPTILLQGALDEEPGNSSPSSTNLNLSNQTLAPGAMISVAVHGNGNFSWDFTQLDLQITPEPLAGQSVVDLGSLGQLIAPVQVEGKWYYHLDRNGDGTTAGDAYYRDTGTYRLSEIYDLFKQDVNGVAGSSTNDTYRYATVNGVKLALPTLGTSPIAGLMNGTALNNATQTNPSYDDLSAIWDAYNGTRVGSYGGQGLGSSNRGSGNITSGAPGAWVNDSYVSATPWPTNSGFAFSAGEDKGYAFLRLYDGLIEPHRNWAMNVALQVL
jgi:hypothetical protein